MNLKTLNELGISHCCYPNLIYNFDHQLIPIRSLIPGEPLTLDYSTLFIEGMEPFKCNCGRIGCRGMIRDFNSIPVRIRDQYLVWMDTKE